MYDFWLFCNFLMERLFWLVFLVEGSFEVVYNFWIVCVDVMVFSWVICILFLIWCNIIIGIGYNGFIYWIVCG